MKAFLLVLLVGLPVTLTLGLGCGSALAQHPAPALVLDQPYVASGTETQRVRAANGTMVDHVTPMLAARDSAGRLWLKKRMVDLRHPDSATDQYKVTMFDPYDQTLSVWCTCDGVMRVSHLRPADGHAVRKAGKGKEAPGLALTPAAELMRAAGLREQVEAWPAETLLGERTLGYKIVQGGRAASSTLVEGWYSPALGLNLRTVEETAGVGTRRSEFTTFKRVEPADGMFASASEYTAED